MIIRARAPLRLGLAGGGTDISPYCDLHGGIILNVTIDRYAYAFLREIEEPYVCFEATDRGIKEKYPLNRVGDLDSNLKLHKAVYKEIINTYNRGKPLAVELKTFCDAPVGSGLGSSSTLVVSMIKAFVEYLNLPLDDYSIANLAYKVERIDCGLQGGRQDQYAATFGGFNFMEFYGDNRAIINPLRIKNWIICELESSLVLFYTGISRESANIISTQSDSMRTDAAASKKIFDSIKQEAVKMKECLLRGDFTGIVESMQQSWENKKKSALSVTNQIIDQAYAAAIQSGALAGKVSGAGGGGYMMFFVPPERRMSVMQALGEFEGQVSNAHFSKHGVQAWRI
jgi:D-glycero-alpha-D-manno-heptose-7-phosphate kinase